MMTIEQEILRPGPTRPAAAPDVHRVDEASAAPGAAWYPDPAGTASMRWWDGAAWTDTVRPIDSARQSDAESGASLDAVDRHSPFEELTGEEFAEPWVASPELENEHLSSADRLRLAAGYSTPMSAPADGPPRGVRSVRTVQAPTAPGERAAGAVAPRGESSPSAAQDSWRAPVAPDWSGAARRVTGSPNTLPGWLLATMPLWFGLIWGLVHAVAPASSDRLGTVFSAVVALIVSFALAWTDAARLRAEGFESVASPLWVFVYQGVYFVLRAIRLGGQGIGMVITFFAIQLLSVVMVIVALAVLIPIILQLGNTDTGPARVSLSDVQPGPVPADALPLSEQDRADQLTPAGMIAVLRQDFTNAGAPIAGARCEPFPAQDANAASASDAVKSGAGSVIDPAATTCLAQVSGWYYDLTVHATPGDPYHAFVVDELVPRS